MTSTRPAIMAGVVLLGMLVAFVSFDVAHAYHEDTTDDDGEDNAGKADWCMAPGMAGTMGCPPIESSCAWTSPKTYSMWGNLGMDAIWGHSGMGDYDKGYGMNDTWGHHDMDDYDKGYGMDDHDKGYGMNDTWGHPDIGLDEYFVYDILSYAASEGTMTITGNAHANAEPETLTIRLGVQTTNPTAGAALSENSRLMTSAVEAITTLGIPEDELSTSYFNIEPRYEGKYDEDGIYTNVFVGYRVSNIIEVTTDRLDMAADIIDASVAAGANSVISVNFGVSPETEKSTRDGLIGDAVCDAVHRAEMALKPIGYRITGVETMHVDSPGAHGSWRLASAQIAEDAAFAGTPIFSGDQSLSASVTVTFFIGPW